MRSGYVEAGQRDRLIRAMVDRPLAVGGIVLEDVDGDATLDRVVRQDPEGNELCVAGVGLSRPESAGAGVRSGHART